MNELSLILVVLCIGLLIKPIREFIIALFIIILLLGGFALIPVAIFLVFFNPVVAGVVVVVGFILMGIGSALDE